MEGNGMTAQRGSRDNLPSVFGRPVRKRHAVKGASEEQADLTIAETGIRTVAFYPMPTKQEENRAKNKKAEARHCRTKCPIAFGGVWSTDI